MGRSMSILTTILMALQIVSFALTGLQQVKPLLPQPQVQQSAPTPHPIAQQPGDRVEYWWDGQRQQWCCLRNGVLFVWAPTR